MYVGTSVLEVLRSIPRQMPDVPPARLWAQLVPARLECPACGCLIWFGSGGPAAHRRAYNRHTSRLTCPACQKVYVVGVLLWNVPEGGRSPRERHPDHELTLKQAAKARQLVGFSTSLIARANDPVNRYLSGECCCWPLGWREECPIHGRKGNDNEGTGGL